MSVMFMLVGDNNTTTVAKYNIASRTIVKIQNIIQFLPLLNAKLKFEINF